MAYISAFVIISQVNLCIGYTIFDDYNCANRGWSVAIGISPTY